MNLFILKTNINSDQGIRILSDVFNAKPFIMKWTVDMEDIDNVLKINCQSDVKEKEVIQLIESSGFSCEALEV
jgi:hypothetical protein